MSWIGILGYSYNGCGLPCRSNGWFHTKSHIKITVIQDKAIYSGRYCYMSFFIAIHWHIIFTHLHFWTHTHICILNSFHAKTVSGDLMIPPQIDACFNPNDCSSALAVPKWSPEGPSTTPVCIFIQQTLIYMEIHQRHHLLWAIPRRGILWLKWLERNISLFQILCDHQAVVRF